MNPSIPYPAVVAILITTIWFCATLERFNTSEKFSLKQFLDDLVAIYKTFIVTLATCMILAFFIIGGEFSYSLKWKEFIEFFKNLIN